MFDHACAECGKTFLSKSKLNQHNKWHQEMTCDECRKVFKKGNFARHLKVHADGVITCQICAKTFSRTDSLQTHVIKCHEESLEQHKCDICEKTFADRQYLKQHMDMLAGAPRKQCKYCETMPLKVHIIVDHLSDYFEEAGKTLRSTSDQFVEAAHHKVNHFIEAHPNYNHVDKSTEEYGQAILAGVVHFNSNNL